MSDNAEVQIVDAILIENKVITCAKGNLKNSIGWRGKSIPMNIRVGQWTNGPLRLRRFV